MAYLHCSGDECSWSQDDFWTEGYNPFQYLLGAWSEDLLSKELDAPWNPSLHPSEAAAIGIPGDTSWRELLAQKAEQAAVAIRKMRWRTQADWEAAGRPCCPECGSPLRVD